MKSKGMGNPVVVLFVLFFMGNLEAVLYGQAAPKRGWNELTQRSGHKSPYLHRAQEAWKKGNYKLVYKLTKNSENGDCLPSKLMLATLYHHGLGIEKDLKAALRLYEKLHGANVPEGCYMAAMCYENGWGTEKNLEKAAKYYFKTASQAHYPEAQRALGSMYFSGRGVAKDYRKAWSWFLKAAKQGNSRALYNVALMKEKGYGTEKNYAEAFSWYEKGAAAGVPKSMFTLGLLYLADDANEESVRKGRVLIEAAAAKELPEAILWLEDKKCAGDK